MHPAYASSRKNLLIPRIFSFEKKTHSLTLETEKSKVKKTLAKSQYIPFNCNLMDSMPLHPYSILWMKAKTTITNISTQIALSSKFCTPHKWLTAVICNQTSISQDRWQFNWSKGRKNWRSVAQNLFYIEIRRNRSDHTKSNFIYLSRQKKNGRNGKLRELIEKRQLSPQNRPRERKRPNGYLFLTLVMHSSSRRTECGL